MFVFVPAPKQKRCSLLPFPSACLCLHGLIFQELVRLRGDTHGQLRDGGRGGDVHQARLSALHLGTVSESCVSASFPLALDSD